MRGACAFETYRKICPAYLLEAVGEVHCALEPDVYSQMVAGKDARRRSASQKQQLG